MTRVRGDDEDVIGLHVEQREQVFADIGVTLELGATESGDVAIAAQHESAQGDAVGGDEATGAAGDLHGEGLEWPVPKACTTPLFSSESAISATAASIADWVARRSRRVETCWWNWVVRSVIG